MGLSLAQRRWGRGPEPLLLVHGFTGSGESFDHLEPLLGARVTALAVDLPGHGATPVPEGARAGEVPGGEETAARWEETVAALCAAIGAEPRPLHLAGYSLGARLALAAALRSPGRLRSLALESGSAGLEGEPERAARRAGDEALAASIDREGVAAFVARWEQTPVLRGLRSLPVAAQEALRARRLRCSGPGLAWSLRGLGPGRQPPLWDRLRELEVPTLLLFGEDDSRYAAHARRMAALLPRAVLGGVAGAGHTPHLEQPARYAAALLEHLARAGPARDGSTPQHRSTP